MTDLPRETVIDTVAFALQLIEQGNQDRACYLLYQLLHRLLVDNAVEEKAEMTEWYGEQMMTQ